MTEEILEGVKVIRLPVEHRQGGAALALLREYLLFTTLATIHAARRSRSRRYDVVQVHNPPDFLVVAALLPRLGGSKLLLDVHDLTPDMFAMRFGNRGHRAVRRAD